MFKPTVIKLDIHDIDIMKLDNSVIFSDNINKPKFKYGFQYFLWRTKEYMSVTNEFKGSKPYRIVNNFEHTIKNYDNDLITYSTKYFNINSKQPQILSRAFFKLWEILLYFDLGLEKNINVIGIAEAPGSFIQCIILFRQKFKLLSSKDRINCLTIYSDDSKFVKMNDKCMASYNSINSKLVNVFKTVPTKESNKSLIKTDGDLTKLKTHNIFNKYISSKKEYANLITADGGFTWKNENYQEQEAYRLILGEIMNCLYNINKDGSFILKVFETFTDVTIKMIYLCGSFFKETYMYKPFMSRTSNSEKYIVFKNFKYDPKDKKLKNMLDKLLTIFKSIDGNKKYIHDIFPSMPINIKYIEQIKYMNIMIMNKQNIMINMIKSFIDKKNNYGVEYHDYMKKQIENTKFWINKFYTDEQNLNKIKKELKEELSKIENYNSNEALLLYK